MLTEPITRSRTLVVDDDEVMRELLLALLDMQGHTVHVVESGDEAVGWLATASAPHFILTDLQMPGMEGLALVQALRGATDSTATRLLGMSGNRPLKTILDSLDGFVLKPFGYAELEAAFGILRPPDEVQTPGGLRTSTDSLENAGSVHAPGHDRTGEAAPILDEAIFGSLRASFRTSQLAELYTMTLHDVAMRQARMGDLAAAGDLLATQREAHAVKGLCGMVGARELGDLADAVEAGTTLDTFSIQQIPAACERLRRMLDSKFGNPTAPAGEHE